MRLLSDRLRDLADDVDALVLENDRLREQVYDLEMHVAALEEDVKTLEVELAEKVDD